MAKSRIKDFTHWKVIPGVGGKQGGEARWLLTTTPFILGWHFHDSAIAEFPEFPCKLLASGIFTVLYC